MNRWTSASAIAVLSALPIAASAQSNVTLYGRLDASVNHQRYSGTPTRSSDDLTALSSDTSLWGLRGSEDLGDGLRAYFKLESGFQIDSGLQSGATAYWNRETYVGLGVSQYGQIQLGSQFAPAVWLSAKTDPFLRSNLGTHTSLMQGGARGYAVQFDNAVQYVSPDLNGFGARFFVAAREGGPGRQWSASGDYKRGPFYVGLAYDDNRIAGALIGQPGTVANSRTLSLGATYTFAPVKLHGWIQQNRISGQGNVNGYMLGVTVPLGLGEIRASLQRRDAGGPDTNLAAAGYFYFLSKRTTLYGVVAKLTNDETAQLGMWPARAEGQLRGFPGPGEDVTGLQVGVRHTF